MFPVDFMLQQQLLTSLDFAPASIVNLYNLRVGRLMMPCDVDGGARQGHMIRASLRYHYPLPLHADTDKLQSIEDTFSSLS